MGKKYLNINVYEAAKKRIAYIFKEFDNVLVAFSGGKDSGVCLNMVYDYAKANDMLNKVAMYCMDYEADYEETNAYITRCFEGYEGIKKYWLCLPVSAQCSCSMTDPYWIPWDKDKQDIWVRPMPDNEHVINEDNVPFAFTKGTYGRQVRNDFAKWFGRKYGKTAVIVGIRCDESLTRLAILTSQHRANMYKDLKYSNKYDENTYIFYPIYDWMTEDVWIANAKNEWDYNKVYDLMYVAGVPLSDARIASPFHSCGQASLKLYRALSPHIWGKMIGRVNGVNFMNIYGGTFATGYKNIKKPPHFTWKEYALFLLKTLPKETYDRFMENIRRFEDSWENKGYGRNPRVIQQMIDEGIIIENTHEISKLCTKPDIYEIVKIKSGIPDETGISDFRHCPSWKAVCITILKNDFTLQYMGVSRSKKDMALRRQALEKYKNL